MPNPYCHSADLKEAVQLMKQGQQLVDQARYREAIDVFQKMARSCGANEECQAAALFWTGRSYLELSLFREAQTYVDQALSKFRALNKPLDEASGKILKARILQGQNEYAAAVELYNQAEEAINRYGKPDNPERFAILANRARLYIYQNQYERALKDIGAARRLIGAKANPRMRGILAEHEGLIASEKGEFPKAIKLFDEAIKLYKEGGHRAGECAALNKRGRAYESLGEYSKALADYEASLNLARQIGSKAEEAFAWNNLGMVHRKRAIMRNLSARTTLR